MVQHLNRCPNHWKKGHPYPCEPQPTPPQPTPSQPTPSQAAQPASPYNIVYLVDEHVVTGDKDQKFSRNAGTIQRRYAWHHQVANLSTFNIGEVPETIQLHEKISNPKATPDFRWEGFMFDIPGGDAACRVAIAAGADKADNATLSTGSAGPGGLNVDRVVGFAGVYPDNKVPLGPVVQVRRDDLYRRLGASLNTTASPVKVAWYCAYYITKETPKQVTSPGATSSFSGFTGVPAKGILPGEGSPDAPPTDAAPAEQSSETAFTTYDQMLDLNVSNEAAVADGETWGGMVFGFTIEAPIPDGQTEDDTILQTWGATDESKGSEGVQATS